MIDYKWELVPLTVFDFIPNLVGRFRKEFGDVWSSKRARELATRINTANDWYSPLIDKIMESVKEGKCSCVVDERDFPGRGWEYAQSWLRKNGYKFHNITYEGYWTTKTYGWGTDYQHESPCWEPGYTSYEVKIEW